MKKISKQNLAVLQGAVLRKLDEAYADKKANTEKELEKVREECGGILEEAIQIANTAVYDAMVKHYGKKGFIVKKREGLFANNYNRIVGISYDEKQPVSAMSVDLYKKGSDSILNELDRLKAKHKEDTKTINEDFETIAVRQAMYGMDEDLKKIIEKYIKGSETNE